MFVLENIEENMTIRYVGIELSKYLRGKNFMRESKFNYFVEDGQTVIIFNSLTGKLATLNKDTYSKLQI